jgi:hypothetical protein
MGPTWVWAGLAPIAKAPLEGALRVHDPEGHGGARGAVGLGELRREGFGLGVQDEVDVALAVERHILRAVPGDGRKAHLLEEGVELLGFRMAVLDELEAVGPHRVLVRDGGRRGIVRERSHGFLLAAPALCAPAGGVTTLPAEAG